jgi:predicted HTH domain antitoxin
VGEYYRKGVMSLQEAATAANVSIYDMMKHVQKEGIRPPVQSVAEIDAEIHDSIERSKSVVKTTKKDAR